MVLNHFIVLTKQTIVVPQSLHEEGCGEIIKTLLAEQFSVSHIHILARNSTEALARYYAAFQHFQSEASPPNVILY